MRTKKGNDSGKVNDKYVNLLVQTFEKYKDISTLGGRAEEIEQNENDESIVKLSNTAKYVRSKVQGSSKSNLNDKAKKTKGYTFHKLFKVKQFTPHEDDVIIEKMKFTSAEEKPAAILELSKDLNRHYKSIQVRIMKLETGSRLRRYKSFSLQEDCLIIDSLVESLKLSKSLEDAQIEDCEKLGKSFGRGEKSIFFRWNLQLKSWLLQYYQKTLNLEIRPMLVNVLADNFDSIHDIDWDWVKKIPEFSGYTVTKLKQMFFNRTVHLMAKSLGMNRTEMTLQTIAETAKHYNFPKVSRGVIERQRLIIDYFEKKVKMEKIEFAELNLP